MLAKVLGKEERLAIQAFADGALYSSEYIEEFVDKSLSDLLKIKDVKFGDLILPTYVVATDLKGKTVKVWSKTATPGESVARAVRASCSIPFYFPVITNQFVDGGLLSNLPTFVFADDRQPSTTRVLAFNLTSEESAGKVEICRQGLIRSLVDTVIDGSGDLQAKLFSVARIEINTGEVRATDFHKIDEEKNSELFALGKEAARSFFAAEKLNISKDTKTGLLPGDDEMRAVITQKLGEHVTQVDICESDTDFIYKMFPSFLEWRSAGVPISAQYPVSAEVTDAERYRRALLRALGVRLLPQENPPAVRSYFFNCYSAEGASCLAGPLQKDREDLESATQYEGISHFPIISALYKSAGFSESAKKPPNFKIVPGDEERLVERLKTVNQYQQAEVTIEHIEFQQMEALTDFVHEFKFRQIPSLASKFRAAGIKLFGCAAVEFENGSQSLITPPVLEEIDGRFVIIEGSTRLTWMRKNGFDGAVVAVVRGVVDPLPAEIVRLDRIWVGHNSRREKRRYGPSFDYTRFRKIEERVHLLEDVADWDE